MLSLIRHKTRKTRTIIFDLKSENGSRDILLRLLTTIANPGDNVLAIHVQEPNDSFDPNTFHIHEDICKSNQVDLQIKVCEADSCISNLTRQVRKNYASMLVLGCSLSRLDYSVFNTCLKGLPPTCTLMVMDNLGKILLQKQGTSQRGSERALLQSSHSSVSKYAVEHQQTNTCHLQKSLTLPSSLSSSSLQAYEKQEISLANTKARPFPNFAASELFPRLALQDSKGIKRHFTYEQLNHATNNFDPAMVIGEGGHSKVYRANLEDGQAVVAVKVLSSDSSSDDLVQEVEILSKIKHENIVHIVGFCNDKNMQAIVYNLLKGSLKQYLSKLEWKERMRIAIGIAKALNYLHHSCNPPIIHRDVKSSNILLFDNFQPQLADFGEATELKQSQNAESNKKPFNIVGTFGYLAPEYIMYGKIDEKIDVYSYGVVLLELITGKEAIQTDHNNHGSLVLWARSLLGCGLGDRLIDPNLKNCNKEEMGAMMMAARLCLLHSSSRRPTMKIILKLFEEEGYLFKMQKLRDEVFNGGSRKGEADLWRYEEESDDEENIITENIC